MLLLTLAQAVLPFDTVIPDGVQFSFFDTSANEDSFSVRRRIGIEPQFKVIARSNGALQGCADAFSDQDFSDTKALSYPGQFLTYCIATQRPFFDSDPQEKAACAPTSKCRTEACTSTTMSWVGAFTALIKTPTAAFVEGATVCTMAQADYTKMLRGPSTPKQRGGGAKRCTGVKTVIDFDEARPAETKPASWSVQPRTLNTVGQSRVTLSLRQQG